MAYRNVSAPDGARHGEKYVLLGGNSLCVYRTQASAGKCGQGLRDGLRISNARLYGTSEATDGRTGCTVTKYSGCDERRQEAKEPVAISSLTVVKVEAWYR